VAFIVAAVASVKCPYAAAIIAIQQRQDLVSWRLQSFSDLAVA